MLRVIREVNLIRSVENVGEKYRKYWNFIQINSFTSSRFENINNIMFV